MALAALRTDTPIRKQLDESRFVSEVESGTHDKSFSDRGPFFEAEGFDPPVLIGKQREPVSGWAPTAMFGERTTSTSRPADDW